MTSTESKNETTTTTATTIKKQPNLEIVVAVSTDNYIGYRDIQKNRFFIPWRIPLDFKYFQELTLGKAASAVLKDSKDASIKDSKDAFKKDSKDAFKKDSKPTSESMNAVIMGRHTWESLPRSPLPDRINIIITKSDTIVTTKLESCKPIHQIENYSSIEGQTYAFTAQTLTSALEFLQKIKHNSKTFVVGGYLLYAEAMSRNDCSVLHITRIGKTVKQQVDPYKTWIGFPDIPSEYKKSSETSCQVLDEKQKGSVGVLQNDLITMTNEIWRR